MPRRAKAGTIPDWDGLYEEALGQAGYFSARQATQHSIGTRLLVHHVKTGRIEKPARAIFRFHRFPSEPHDELVPLWLWSERQGVFSHETALMLHNLSDVSPVAVTMTLPALWRIRRLTVPDGLILHFSEVPAQDRGFMGALPVTRIVRTLNDCAEVGLEEQFLRQAVREALADGRLRRGEVPRLRPELQAFVPEAKRGVAGP